MEALKRFALAGLPSLTRAYSLTKAWLTQEKNLFPGHKNFCEFDLTQTAQFSGLLTSLVSTQHPCFATNYIIQYNTS